jgi:hypothetical protein
VPLLEVGAAWDVVVEPQQEAAAWDVVVEPQREAAAAWDVVAEPPPEAVSVAAAEPRQAAGEARGAVAGARLRGAAPDVPAVQRRAAVPSAVPWVFRRGQPPPWPVPPPAAQLARAMERARIAAP